MIKAPELCYLFGFEPHKGMLWDARRRIFFDFLIPHQTRSVRATRIWSEAGEVRDAEAMFQGQETVIRAQGEEDEDVPLPLHIKTHQPVLPPYINAGRNQQGHLGTLWHIRQ